MTHTAAPPVPASPSTPVNGVPHPAVRPAVVNLTKPTDVPAPVPVPEDAPDPSTDGEHVPAWARARHAAWCACTHERTRGTLRLIARHTLYTVGGLRIVTHRVWDSRTASRYERMIRAAEAAGNAELAKEWEERCTRFRAARHQRRMELLQAPAKLAKAAAVGTAVTAVLVLVLGVVLAFAEGDPTRIAVPAMALVQAVSLAVWLVAVVWGPLLVLAPFAGVLVLWDVGRRQQAAPQWAMPAAQRTTEGPPITPSVVVTALRDLGIPALRKALAQMQDAGAAMLSPVTLAGCGVEVDATLPTGVTTEEVMNRRRKLAENLGRHEHEVYVSVAPAARTVRMWIADSGALDEPVGTSPLVNDTSMKADYKNGRAPWGLDLRGDQAALSVYQRHMLITGLSNQGKTASLRALALWLALDPAVEFRVADLKGVGDWSMVGPRASVLIEGPTDDHVAAATRMVEDGFAEMNRRLVSKEKHFPPLVLIVDEAQVAYGSAAKDEEGRPYGGQKATSRYLRAVKGIHDQGRAVNVTIWEGTQDPTDQNLPKRSREGNHIRASLVLNTESQAAMALGESPVQSGAAPHKLRQGFDRGQLVVTGDGLPLAPGQTFVNVRTYYVNDDQAEEIITRAVALRSGKAAAAADEHGDHLAAILEALGPNKRLRTQEVLQQLANTDEQYRSWTFPTLKAELDAAGASPHKSGGVMVVSRAAVEAAIEERDADRADDNHTEGGDE